MPARPDWPQHRVLAWLYSPPPQRARVAALFGIEAEIRASLRPGLEHEVAHARLGWWQEECRRCAAGQPSHPLTRALAASFSGADAAALTQLTGLVDTAVWDLAGSTFEQRRELSAYCERWSTALVLPLARGALPGTPSAGWRALGSALKEIEMLCTLARDARAGRLRLPLAELAAARVPPEALAQPPWPPELAELLRERHRQLRLTLSAAVGSLAAPAQAALRGLMVWATLLSAYSQRAVRALPDSSPAGDHRRAFDGYRAWRAARRAAGGRLQLSVE